MGCRRLPVGVWLWSNRVERTWLGIGFVRLVLPGGSWTTSGESPRPLDRPRLPARFPRAGGRGRQPSVQCLVRRGRVERSAPFSPTRGLCGDSRNSRWTSRFQRDCLPEPVGLLEPGASRRSARHEARPRRPPVAEVSRQPVRLVSGRSTRWVTAGYRLRNIRTYRFIFLHRKRYDPPLRSARATSTRAREARVGGAENPRRGWGG